MNEMTWVRPGSVFMGATDGWNDTRMRAVVVLEFAHPTHPQRIEIDHDVWSQSGIRVEPRRWLTDGSPGDLFDPTDPAGDS
jgi:hypothetical protein